MTKIVSKIAVAMLSLLFLFGDVCPALAQSTVTIQNEFNFSGVDLAVTVHAHGTFLAKVSHLPMTQPGSRWDSTRTLKRGERIAWDLNMGGSTPVFKIERIEAVVDQPTSRGEKWGAKSCELVPGHAGKWDVVMAYLQYGQLHCKFKRVG